MILKKLFILSATLFLFVELFACSIREETTTDCYTPIIENEYQFTYDTNSEYSKADFENLGVYSALAMEFGPFVFHQNADSIYTVLSLRQNGLCYVFIEYIEGTGISWYIQDVIEFPSNTVDQDFYSRILVSDYPNEILN